MIVVRLREEKFRIRWPMVPPTFILYCATTGDIKTPAHE